MKSLKNLVSVVMIAAIAPVLADPSAPGVPIESADSEWEIIVTPEGYSDLLLDKRPGFLGREYLSGEWAAAIHYEGGSNPTEAIWFRKTWAFPCWDSNSNFSVVKPVTPITTEPDPSVQGAFLITSAESIIKNDDVEITILYEMVDSGEGNGIAQGDEPISSEAGNFTRSTRHFLRQTYTVKNISGGPLTNVKFYQFLHGLHSTVALQDHRLYTGLPFEEYRYDSTQRGTTKGFESDTGEIFEHDDVLTMHARQEPSAFEVGEFGVEGTDDHVFGKPSVGVHHSIEANSLSGLDFFAPPVKWVSGGMCFELADLGDGETDSIDVLLSLSTTSRFLSVPPEIDVENFGFQEIDPGNPNNNATIGCSADGTLIQSLEPLFAESDLNTEDWTEVTMRLPNLERPFRIQFQFLSAADEVPNGAGWYLDDVRVGR